MNIVFITTLLPTTKLDKRTDKSYVLHSFLKNWFKDKNINLVVIYPREKMLREEFCFFNLKKIIKTKGFFALYKHFITTCFPTPENTEEFCFDGVRGYKVWLRKYWKRKYIVSNITHILKKNERPDVIVSHMPYGLLVAGTLKQKIKVPHIHGVHKSDLTFYSKKLYKKIYETIDAYVYRSPAIEKHAQKTGLKSDYSKVLPSGIEKNLIIEQVRSFDFNKEVKFLSACSLIKLKNINYNLIALSKLPANINWEYTIIGSGEEEQYLKQLACDLDISKRVHFKGFLDRDKCLDEMLVNHIYIQVSAPETLGMVYLEAMAKGMIVIGCKDYGVDGLVIDGKNGFLCMPENSEELKNKILDILNYRNLDLILQNALSSIKDLTEERACIEYLNFIKEVASDKLKK